MTSGYHTTLQAELSLLLQHPMTFYNEVISRSGKASVSINEGRAFYVEPAKYANLHGAEFGNC